MSAVLRDKPRSLGELPQLSRQRGNFFSTICDRRCYFFLTITDRIGPSTPRS